MSGLRSTALFSAGCLIVTCGTSSVAATAVSAQQIVAFLDDGDIHVISSEGLIVMG